MSTDSSTTPSSPTKRSREDSANDETMPPHKKHKKEHDYTSYEIATKIIAEQDDDGILV